jgi:hypothetical protein
LADANQNLRTRLVELGESSRTRLHVEFGKEGLWMKSGTELLAQWKTSFGNPSEGLRKSEKTIHNELKVNATKEMEEKLVEKFDPNLD